MLVNITEYFIESGREWQVGQNPDVPREVAAMWIADGKATADTDGVRNQSPVSGGGNGYRTVLFGDSMVDTYESVVSPVTGAYNSATGDLTITYAGHQQAVGWYATPWLRGSTYPVPNGLLKAKITSVIDSSNFVLNVGAGRNLPASDANWRYRPESWRSAQAFATWLQGVSNQRFNILHNGGGSGDTAAEALLRIKENCLDFAPDLVICQMPGVNDTSGSFTTRSLDAIVADRHAIVDRIVGSGARLVLLTTTPVQTGEVGRANLLAMSRVAEMNRRLVEYCRGKGGVRIFDAYGLIVDPANTTGLAKSSLGYLRTTDNIHYSMRGGRACGEALWAAIQNDFPAAIDPLPKTVLDGMTASALTLSAVTVAGGICSATASAANVRVGDRFKVWGGSAPAFNEFVTIASAVGTAITFNCARTAGSVTGTIRMSAAANMVDNPLFTTATGGTVVAPGTGTLPSGVKVVQTTGSPAFVCSVPSRSDGIGNDVQVVITPAAAGNQVGIVADYNWTNPAGTVAWPLQIAAGRRYVFEGELSLSGVGGSNLTELRPVVEITLDGTAQKTYGLHGYNDGPCLNTDMTAFHFRTAPFVVPPFSACTSMGWGFYLTFSASGTAVTVKLGRLRLVEYEA